MTPEQKEQFEKLVCCLSPENISCDGECSITQVNKRYREIQKEWRKLEKEVGRKVSHDEVENWITIAMWERIGMSKEEIEEASKKYLLAS